MDGAPEHVGPIVGLKNYAAGVKLGPLARPV
jgi:hypothetical protein